MDASSLREAALALVLLLIAVAVIQKLRRRTLYLANVPGPGGGHPLIAPLIDEKVDREWTERYGGIVRYEGAFGEQRLFISDPKALHYIMQTSGYGFMRSEDRKENMRTLLGKGILTVEGDDHRRQRRIMLPCFGRAEANAFVPSFALKAAQVSSFCCAVSMRLNFDPKHTLQVAERWTSMMASGGDGKVVDIPSWAARATLGTPPLLRASLAAAVFNYDLHALDENTDNKFVNVYHNLFPKIRLAPTNLEILAAELLALVPAPLMRWWHDTVPDRRLRFMTRCRRAADGLARELVERERAAVERERAAAAAARVVRANATANPKARLEEQEVYAQLLTILLAGHETTANALSWTLLELARHPAIQSRLRTEIRTTRRARGEPTLTSDTIQAMPFLHAVVKESLRFHPPLYNTTRTATRDEVIPLLRPVLDKRGRPVYEVAVPKGQYLVVSFAAYGRNKDLYGPDADDFNPERWLKEGYVNTPAGGGMLNNLLTFGGGHRGCLGWRYAVLELSAFLVELIDRFEFSAPPDVLSKIRRGAAGVMVPMLEGELDRGAQLPLHVRPAST
ncbi:cytochrome P450 [Schizophyllum fasciatum]